ncbi:MULTISPECIES: histone-like protein [Paenibacillus]|uniref:Histone H3/H4 n=1 Tax=Paenibacillus polysaccharolyticus TaxID=582692 RepID=A0A1G5ASE0_9BACL|nr:MULTISPECIES: histone-like protein [Paenibacillus]MCK6075388.1 hypothetical protein [Paenibacillus silvae]MCK6149775.1 hypothetical protein [Paenibacillus silvae]MCK6268073.1 hypothetical protein [Paenibacillus silvae]SCX80814.1 histone H3/H4 [Paenibacillus polysaccharolyticus]
MAYNVEAEEYQSLDEEEFEHEEDDGAIRVSRKGTLSKFVRTKTSSRVTNGAKDMLMAQLEQITIMLVKRAEEVCASQGRSTIYDSDLQTAYEELMQPHEFIDKIILELDNQKEQLKIVAQSSLVRHMEV